MHKKKNGAYIRHRTNKVSKPSWQVRWRERGVLHSKNFGSLVSAEEFARKVGIVKDIQSVMASSLAEPGRLKDLIPRHVEMLRAKNKPGSSHADQVQYTLTRDIERMGVCWTTDIDTNAIDRLVRIYAEHRSTLKKAITTFKTFIRWARRSRYAIDDWVLEYKGPKHIPEERIAWNEDQVRRLLAECDKPNTVLSLPSGDGTGRGSRAIMDRMVATRDLLVRKALRPALWLMLRYAPRPIEVARLTVGNWDSEARTLYFPGKITKNGHPRDYVVDEETARMLDAAAGNRPLKESLFLTYKGRAYTSHHLTDLVNRLIERARLPGTAYCSRHTASTRLVQLAKGDLPLVQSISGHRGLSELQRYLHATNDRRKAIAEAYNEKAEAASPPVRHLRLVK